MTKNIKDLPRHQDDRGIIQMLMESCEVGSVSGISTEANNGRASHYHKNDEHTIFVTTGQEDIYERPAGSDSRPVLTTLRAGDVHRTAKMVEHYMWMPEATTFFCFSKLPRDSDSYEEDTVRFSHDLKIIFQDQV